jgi:structural maintenance of chromosomes protein 6
VTVYEDEPDEAREDRYEARIELETQNLEKDDFRSTQLVRKHYDEVKENQPAQNGIIERVSCWNFMCHKKLVVDFGPLINFIIGHNGSGKSAVLTALTICLGGKATSTNRGQNLKSFIKEGEESCTLAVKLKNQGETGFRPDLYGDSIIVERYFSRTGPSGYKIRGANQRVISTKRADLDDISDHFALQLDNPMNVLTQDMARQFLNNSSAADKYKFFVKGTQLEQLDSDYLLLEENLDHTEAKINQRQSDIQILKEQYEAAERKRRTAELHEGLNDRIHELSRQMAWAQVEEQERYLGELDQQMLGADHKIQQRVEAAEEVSTAFDQAEQEHQTAQQAVQSLQEELEPREAQHAEMDEQWKATRARLREQIAEQRDIQGHLRSTMVRVETEKGKIVEEKRRLEDQNGGEHARKLEEVQAAKDHSEQLEQAHREHMVGRADLIKRRDQTGQQALDAKSIFEEKQKAVAAAEANLRNLRNHQGQHNRAYDPNIGSLLRAIQAERRFVDRPVGPIGNHVRLKPSKTEWSSILETTFGNILNSFVVSNKADEKLLSEISRRVKW